jgi:cytochrome c oxidase cbb3-type subunit 2
MIRTLKDEVERYGHYSLAAESMYDHPFQWGSKRTGPDLARVGGKYSDDWHAAHMTDPRSVVPESIMPGYPFLGQRKLDYGNITERMETLRIVGVPYTDDDIRHAKADLVAQTNPDSEGAAAVAQRYPKAQIRKFDGKAGDPTELDAVIAYLQMLGTLVDFAKYDSTGPNLR